MLQIAQVDLRHPEAGAQFALSLKNAGFAVLNHHPISSKLIFDTYAEWARFFESEEKHKLLFDAKTQSGYFPFKSENAKDYKIKDLKEFYHVYKFADIPSSMSALTKELFIEMTNLGAQLLSWLEEQTPTEIRRKFSMPLPKMIEGSKENLLRILHYPPLTGTEEQGAVRAAAHEDINLITLLPAATAPGLQAKDLSGRWIDIECNPGNLVINAGDMLQMATEGYYRSTTHQVVNPSDETAKASRHSMPLFLHPKRDVVLSTLEDGSRMTAGRYLDERLREIGLLAATETHATT